MKLRSLRAQLLIYGGGLMLLIIILLLSLFSYRVNSFLKEELVSSGEYLVVDFSRASEFGVSAEDLALARPFIDAFFEREDIILTALYNHRGALLFFKKEADVGIEENIDPQIRERLKNEREVLRIKAKTKDGASVYEFYAPVFTPQDKDMVIGFSKLTFSLGRIGEQVRQMILYGFFVSVLVVLVGVFLLFLLARTLTEPLLILKKGVNIIGKGNLDYRIHVKAKNEIGELSQSFNKMVEDLQRSHAALEESKTVLEIKVAARTKELRELAAGLEVEVERRTKEIQEKMADLERFQKLAVGRELKMVELKKEIEKLKKELEK